MQTLRALHKSFRRATELCRAQKKRIEKFCLRSMIDSLHFSLRANTRHPAKQEFRRRIKIMRALRNGPFTLEEAIAEFSVPEKWKRYQELEEHVWKHTPGVTDELHKEARQLHDEIKEYFIGLLKSDAICARAKLPGSSIAAPRERIDPSSWDQMSIELAMGRVFTRGENQPLSIQFFRNTESGSGPEAAGVPFARFLRIAVDYQQRTAFMDHGIRLTGANFDLIDPLFKEFEKCLGQNAGIADWTCVDATQLARSLDINETSVTVAVKRVRDELASQFLKAGIALETDDVIENVRGRGYRLNPHLSLTSAAILAEAH